MSRARGCPRIWWCAGCEKDHPLDRYIEGLDPEGGRWCRHSMKRALKERWNRRPLECHLDALKRELGQ